MSVSAQPEEGPVEFLYQGEFAHIRLVTPADAPLLHRWLGGPGERYRRGLPRVCPSADELASRIALQRAIQPPVEYEVLILRAADAAPVGVAALTAIDPLNAKAELSLAFVAGRGGHCFLESLAFVLEGALGALALHKLIFHVDADNQAVLRLLRRHGARPEGVLVGELDDGAGGRLDLHRFALFRDQWLAHPLRRRMSARFPRLFQQLESP